MHNILEKKALEGELEGEQNPEMGQNCEKQVCLKEAVI